MSTVTLSNNNWSYDRMMQLFGGMWFMLLALCVANKIGASLTGPYRWVKHPLYLAEEIAILGVVLQYLTPVTVVVLVLHIGVQVCRILYEEDLLRRHCPEYSTYEASRWRLIPYVW